MRSVKPSPNPQEAGSHGSGGPGTGVVLEIGRGRTEHRKRPVQSSRFLIGSSPRCDLCLGGAEIPPLHSMICTDGTEVWLEAMADSPELLVNGRPEKSVRLKDQDRLRIEPFELIVHVPANIPASTQFLASDSLRSADQESKSSEPSDPSAVELVERIEAATQLVNEFEQRNRLGMESLLSAVQERRNRMLAGPATAPQGTVLPMSSRLCRGKLSGIGRSGIAGRTYFRCRERAGKAIGRPMAARGRLPRRRVEPVRDSGSIVPPTRNPAATGRLSQHRTSDTGARPSDRLSTRRRVMEG